METVRAYAVYLDDGSLVAVTLRQSWAIKLANLVQGASVDEVNVSVAVQTTIAHRYLSPPRNKSSQTP